MTHDLRLAAPEDRAAVEAVVEAAYAQYVPRIGRKPGPMLDDYGRLIGEGRVHVAARGDAVEGIVVLIPEDTALLLDNVAVAPAVQGTGVGRKLLEFAERSARDAGYRSIRLYTNAAMTENIGLYTRIGYRETHRGGEGGLRRVYMAKPLE